MRNMGAVLIFAFVVVLMAATTLYAEPVGGEKALLGSLERITVGEPVTSKNIAIFPLIGSGSKDPQKIKLVTLDEAIARGGIICKELERESVNQIMIQNSSAEWVFIMAGEILTGSKQDRILKNDLLLPPKSGRLVVDAYCVEHGRWSYNSKSFSSEKTASNISVRQKARETSAQGAVWDAVQNTQSNLGYESKSGALSETYKAPAIEKGMDDLYDAFKSLPDRHPGTRGAVVAIGGEILCIDIFNDDKLFEKLWPKLLKSYLLEGLSSRKEGVNARREEAKQFLGWIPGASIKASDAIGEGVRLSIDSSRVTGSALTYESMLIHSDLFPRTKGVEKNTRNNNVENIQPIQRRY